MKSMSMHADRFVRTRHEWTVAAGIVTRGRFAKTRSFPSGPCRRPSCF